MTGFLKRIYNKYLANPLFATALMGIGILIAIVFFPISGLLLTSLVGVLIFGGLLLFTYYSMREFVEESAQTEQTVENVGDQANV